jgi:phospholipid/cholesterol/gamma-HCH transport system substrate-binding protein
METRANYVLVGVFVLALTAAALFFALWLAKAQYERATERYDIYFVGSVSGLKKGSFVSYRGIPVGEVVDLQIDPKNLERVVVTIEIQASTPIRADTVASLEVQGLAGGTYILLSGGTQTSPPLTAKNDERYPVIASVPSRIEQVLQSAPAAVEHINLLLARANELLSPENRLAISNTFKNFDKLTGTLAEETPDIKKAIADFSTTMANLRDATAELDRAVASADTAMDSIGHAAGNADKTFSDLGQQVGPLISDLRQTSKSMKEMADQVGGMVAENREPLHNFSGTASIELTGLLSDMRDLVNHLDRLTSEIERDPARFFFGNQQQGYDATKK